MNDFLEEWEWPDPNDRRYLVEPFESGPFAWRGEQVMVTICVVHYRIFFRPDSSANNYTYAFFGNSPEFLMGEGAATKEKARHLLLKAATGNLVPLRFFWLASYRPCWIFSSRCAWSYSKYPSGIFRLPFDENEASATIYQWLQESWGDKNSEARFAYDWCNWSYQKHFDFLCEKLVGLRELMEMARLVAICEELDEDYEWYLGTENLASEIRGTTRQFFPSEEFAARFQRWSNILNSHFDLVPLDENEPLCLLEYAQLQLSHLKVRGENATAHERIEAALKLREWLRKNAPDRMDLLSD